MTRTLLLLASVATACGPGTYAVEPVAAGSECSTFDCPLLAGGEVRGRPVLYTDVTELVRARSVTVSPAELADAVIDGDYIVVRPALLPAGTEPAAARPGEGTLHITLHDGTTFEQPFSVATLASTSVLPHDNLVPLDAFATRTLPGSRLAMFEGESLVVVAEHRSADGVRLLGHTEDTWVADGVQLAELDPAYSDVDVALVRRVRATSTGIGSVALGAAAMPLDIVPAHTSSRLEVLDRRDASPTTPTGLRLYAGSFTSVSLMAYAADGRFIFGGPPFIPVTVTSSDPTVIDVRDEPITAARSIDVVAGYRSGTATLTFAFDGLSIDVPVSVE